jgi:hypothetical protein
LIKGIVTVEAKMWSKDAQKQVHYSNWEKFDCITVDSLKEFDNKAVTNYDKYGGNKRHVIGKTPFFTTVYLKNRWWLVTPEGNAFKNNHEWMTGISQLLKRNGFNTAGSWSDVAAIKAYNQIADTPIVYCTQLSLLASYAQKNKKEKHTLAYVFDTSFKTYCNSKLQASLTTQDINDVNLLGHFSDCLHF